MRKFSDTGLAKISKIISKKQIIKGNIVGLYKNWNILVFKMQYKENEKAAYKLGENICQKCTSVLGIEFPQFNNKTNDPTK